MLFVLLLSDVSQAARSYVTYPGRLHTARISLLGERDSLILRVISPLTIDVCADLQPIGFTTSYDRTSMDIMIDDFSYTVSGKDCDKGTQMAITNIPLDVKKIEENGITLIRLWKDTMLDSFTLELDDTGATLKPTKKLTFFQPLKKNALSRVFTNKDTVILYLDVPPVADVSEKIHALAISNGLVPDERKEKTARYEQPRFYFLDKEHKYDKQLENGGSFEFGKVNVKVDRNGPYRAYGESVTYTIYAKKP